MSPEEHVVLTIVPASFRTGGSLLLPLGGGFFDFLAIHEEIEAAVEPKRRHSSGIFVESHRSSLEGDTIFIFVNVP